MFSAVDSALVRDDPPAFVKYAVRGRTTATVPRDLDVPLILVFSYDQYQRAAADTREAGAQ